MKRNRICPKCECADIACEKGCVGAYGAGNYVQVSAFSSVAIYRYICLSCGYTEEWIDAQDLEKIKKSKNKKIQKA